MSETRKHLTSPHRNSLRLAMSQVINQLYPPSIYRERRLHGLKKALEERRRMLARIDARFDSIGRPMNSDGEWEEEVDPGFAVVVVKKDRRELDMYEVFDDSEYVDGGVEYVHSEAGASTTQETLVTERAGTTFSGVATNNRSGHALPTTLAPKRFGRN